MMDITKAWSVNIFYISSDNDIIEGAIYAFNHLPSDEEVFETMNKFEKDFPVQSIRAFWAKIDLQYHTPAYHVRHLKKDE